nr:APC family permease [Motilibacter deserti]
MRRNAISAFGSAVIGLASTAPAYSLAVTVGLLADEAGGHAAGIMLLAVAPMLLVALAYRELNAHEPDAGTTFAWVARAFGPRTGWLGGWAVVVSSLFVMASLAQVAAQYLFLLVGADGLADSRGAQLVAGLVWIGLLTWLCSRGITTTAATQTALLLIELVLLLVFTVKALWEVVVVGHQGSTTPEASWLDPFGAGMSATWTGLLLAVFLYWGWDSSFSVNEETAAPRRGPAIAALAAIGVLVVVLVGSTVAVIAWGGVERTAALGDEDVLAAFAQEVLGGQGGNLLLLCVLSSAVAGTQTTIVPMVRTVLSMGAHGAMPAPLARVEKDSGSPALATWVIGAVSAALFVAFLMSSENALADSVEATALGICAYYGLTCAAVPAYFRGHLSGRRNIVFRLIVPIAGSAWMVALLIGSVSSLLGGESKVFGIATPVLFAAAALLAGLVLMATQRRGAYFTSR